MRYIILLLLLLVVNFLGFSQTLDPFTIRYQNLQKGGIRIISNVSLGATNSSLNYQTPPTGTAYNNNATMGYVDIDGNASTFMSSSDSLNLSNCSEILWAGLYWGALVGNGSIQTTLTNYANRDKVKVKINNGAYTTLTADEIFNQSTNGSYKTYHCFKNVTSLVTSAGIKAKFTIADLVSLNHTQFPSTNGPYGGWSIVVVYKNIFQSQRLLTVYDGLTSVNGTNQVNIPISGFVTPQVGPVSFELGIVTLDGDRGISGDQLKFNNLNISDAIHSVNDICNSTISYNGVLTPFRNPLYTNTLGYDANIFIPNNATQQYIGNNATTASISQTSTGDQYFSQVVTFAIDVYEPDLRASVSINDLNGGNVAPGDILEYTIVGKNIGSDIANGVYIRDTLDPRTVYLPNSLQILSGPNTGFKTDVTLDDQAEYFSASKVVQFRVGTGANATTGGQMLSANSGADSTVVKFKVTVINDCLMFQCDSTLDHKAYIFGTSVVSGNFFNNNGLADFYGPNGCPAIASNVLSINVSGCPPDVITANTPICAGTNLSLSIPNSSAAQYSWTGPNGFTSTGFNNASISNTTVANSGLYQVQVTFPGLDCLLNKTKLVTINPLPTISLASQTNVLCNSFTTGALTVNVTNATAPFTYLWSNNATTNSITSIAAGNYTVQVTDSNSCVKTASYTLTQPTVLNAVISNLSNYNGVNISCFSGNNGSALVTASGGVGPYTYLWNNGSTSPNPTNLVAGINSVTVTDANLCTKTVSVTLTQPNDLQLSQTHQNISCFGGNDGLINLSVSGGTGPFTYLWSNGQTTQNLSNLSIGTYSITVTDANGCSAFQLSSTLTQPLAALTSSETHVNILCYGNATGSIDLTVSGGTSPYTYLWSNNAITQDISSLLFGSYSVTVTDNKNCQTTNNIILSQPAAALNSTETHVNVLCNGFSTGSVDITPSGGTAPYTYLWSNNATTQDIAGLTDGPYSVTITDTNACTFNLSITITEPPLMTSSDLSTNILCYGNSTGAINLTVNGGVQPYTFLWSNSATTEDLTNLSVGTYSVIIKDINNCIINDTIAINQPNAPLSSTETHVNVLCKGFSTGSIDLTVNGGTAPYTYLWSNGQTTQDIDTLISGNYSVIVTDSNACVLTDTLFINQPLNVLSLTTLITPVKCFGDSTGAIDISVLGGTSPYYYLWSNTQTTQDISTLNTGNYSVTITDTNACVLISDTIAVSQPLAPLSISHIIDDVNCFSGNDGAIDLSISGGTTPYTYAWSNGQTTQDLINLTTGSFNVIVTDTNNCIIHDSLIFVPQPAASYALSTINADVLCYGFSTGAINFNVTGGTLPYTYLWSNGQTSQDIDSLTVGSYEVIVTDSKGCKDSITTTLIQPFTPLALSITHTDALCIGGVQGTIDLTAGGGTGPYTYFWNNNKTIPDIDSLNQGFYYCLVTDMHGCFDTISATILDPNNNMVLSISNTDVQCYAGSDGTVNLTVQFGTPGYNYIWNNGATTQDLSNVPIGTYSVDVTDFNTCGAFISIVVDQPATPVSGTTSTVDVLCKTFATGSIDASASGGVAPYTYLWSNTSTNQDIQNLTAGIYTLTIKDSHNCILAISDTIFEPATVVSATNVHTNVNCFGGSDGTINLIPAGGVGNYTFLWSNSQTTEDIDSLILGTYNVTITDSNNCVLPYSVLITQPIAPISLATSITNVSCFGGSNGIINLTPNGGTAPYTYFWSDSTTNQDLTNAPIGTYSVIVTDTNNCVDSISGVLIQPTLLVISGSSTPVICHGDATGTATVVANGGTPGYSYLWSNGDQNALNDSILTGSYSVLVTDSLGCQDSLTVFVNEPTLLTSSTTHIDNPCYGNSVGSVSVVPAGGIAPYTYLWSNFAPTPTTSNLIAGVYTVVVKDSNNCIVNDTSEVLQPLAPLAINFAITDNICFNGISGAIDATITGGTAPYSYLWNTTAITQDINNLPIGIYTLSIIDTQNCVLSKTDTIVQPTQIDTSNVLLDDISCNGFSDGSVNLTTVGGTAPYTYLWSNNTTNEDLTNVIIGTYTVTITDNNLCTRQFTYTLNQPLPLISTYTTIEPLCYAYSDGSITLNTTGGTTPYSFSWTNGSTSAINSGIVTGNYTATITDAQNCVFVLPCFIDQPAQIQVSFNVSDTVGCDPTTIEFTNTSDEQFISTWQFGDGNSATGNTNIENTYNSPGCFDVSLTVESPIGCTNSVIYPSIICINPTPTAGISANPTTLDTSNPETEILNTTTGAVSYEWDMGDNGLYNFFQPGMYTYPMYTLNEFLITLTATSDKGCVDTAQYTIFFDNSLIFYVPNTFTPDGNEYNNVFKPILTSLVVNYQMQIYNRWGELIFESFDKEIGWDGSYKGGIVQNGAYTWVIKIKTDGTQTHVKRGNVMLLR